MNKLLFKPLIPVPPESYHEPQCTNAPCTCMTKKLVMTKKEFIDRYNVEPEFILKRHKALYEEYRS